ncbi:Protein CBG07673 [Caenorhabditis briggsae]|uniref:Protein CBG07673 n=1 Tax=Caenorhabditis briggsae TaxID=6238 RepID=A8X4B4_CAEBR|nr:Protein CBG07673 [Caenorhabditis briggsae]CAP27474.2 Protein CBG07673 [Caenorhabditis briggsae]
MPVVRQYGASVRERVAAIEKRDLVVVGKSIENSVIRAKYEPDVRGINRFDTFIRSRKKKKNVSLPQLNHSPKPSKSKQKDAAAQSIAFMEERARLKTSSESDSSMQSNYSGIRLNDALAVQHKALSPKRTFASLDSRQNGVIINRPLKNSLEVALPPRSKSAQDIEGRAESKPELSPLSTDSVFVLATSRLSNDMATQTSKKHVSTASVEFLNVSNCVRSTQTDSTPIVINSRRKSEAPPSLKDIEEREALLEVIEDALGETFDRYSRVRTNQIIANSARKQAQIWRDVKDFLGCNLFPSAIQLANKSTTKSQNIVEIVTSIKTYP